MANTALLRTASNDDIDQEALAQQQVDQQPQPAVIVGLATYINTCWQAAKSAKVEIETELINCERQRAGEYTTEEKQAIEETGGIDIFMLLTEIKCRAIESWLKDVELPPGDKPWTISPTPVPSIDVDIMAEIENRVKAEVMQYSQVYGAQAITQEMVDQRTEELKAELEQRLEKRLKEENEEIGKYLNDQLVEGGYYKAISEFIDDVSTFPTGFIKGPMVRMNKSMDWASDPRTGQKVPQVQSAPKRFWDRVSPYDMYFAPGSKHIQDGYLIERERLRRRDIFAMIGVDGYDETAIRNVLTFYGRGNTDWLWTDQERADMLKQIAIHEDPEAHIDCLNFWGSVQGRDLIIWGMSPQEVADPDEEYDVNCKLIGEYVIMARLNPHPLGAKPYRGASFVRRNGSPWGKAPPKIMRDCQRMCNAAARSLGNNMNMASGPQVEVHTDRVDTKEDAEDVYPWKIWKTKSDRAGHGREAVHFFQPEIIVDALLKIYEYFSDQASEVTVPAYIYGDENIGGAGKTASGLSMLLNMATKTLKDAVRNIDEDVVVPTIEDLHLHVLLYDQDEIEGFGDIKIVARASEYLMIQEQLQVRRGEFLAQTNNPTDNFIIGILGRAAVLREQAKALKMQPNEVVPDDQTLMQRIGMNNQEPPNEPVSEGNSSPSAQTGRPVPLLPGGDRYAGKGK